MCFKLTETSVSVSNYCNSFCVYNIFNFAYKCNDWMIVSKACNWEIWSQLGK